MSLPKKYGPVKEYNEEWESFPQLQDWIAPSPDDSTRAYCKVCKKEITATLNAVVLHSACRKHRIQNGEETLVYMESSEGDGSFDAAEEGKKRSPFSIKYSEKWERDPKFSEWIKADPASEERAICTLCRTTLRAHKADLYKHLSTIKHKTNYIISSSQFRHPYVTYKKRTVQEKFQRPDGSFVIVEDDEGFIFPNPENVSPDKVMEPDMYFEVTDGLVEEQGIGALPQPTSYQGMKKFDQNVSSLANKVGDIIMSDMKRLLLRQKKLIDVVSHEGFATGQEGIERVTRVLIGHLSQHYLVESAVNSWKDEQAMENEDDGSLRSLVDRLGTLEENFEGSITEVRDLKSQVETPPATHTILQDINMLEEDPTTHSISIDCNV